MSSIWSTGSSSRREAAGRGALPITVPGSTASRHSALANIEELRREKEQGEPVGR